MKSIIIGFVIVASVVGTATTAIRQHPGNIAADRIALKERTKWVDSMMAKMTLDERIGQLFMIRAYSDKGAEHTRSIKNLITNYKIGGLCFFQGTAGKQIELINEYQGMAQPVPLMISMDAEWGPAMRFKTGVVNFPRQMTMGAIRDNRLIYQFGVEVARELKRIGVHINFAPTIDVNNNINNPVIGTRSFSENKYLVSQKGYMYMLGLQSEGVMACAKHFPGHGDTNIDSHYDVPVLPFDKERLESMEMYPFRVLVNQGVKSVMIGHLVVPALDSAKNMVASLSKPIITGWLKERLQFDGLVITDALDMKGVTKNFQRGQIEVKAIEAGVDVLLLSESVPLAVKEIKAALKSGELTEARIDESVRKILSAKYDFGLASGYTKISPDNPERELMSGAAKALNQKLIEHALTLVKNEGQLVPVKNIQQRVASLAVGSSSVAPFQKQMDAYCKATHHHWNNTGSTKDRQTLLKLLSEQDLVVVGVTGMNNSNKDNYKLNADALAFINELSALTKVVLIAYGNPYSLSNFVRPHAVMCAFNDDDLSQSLAVQAIFGGLPIRGRLPVTAFPYPFEGGLEVAHTTRISYGQPESVGMDSEVLKRLDAMAQELISTEAAPGCQILLMKDGKVVYDKQFGKFNYARNAREVTPGTIYDLASITKIAATTIGVMKLYENGEMDIFKTIGVYLPYLRGSNKEFMYIRDIMAHQSGLFPWIPFYKETLTGGPRMRPSALIYDSKPSDVFGIKVAHRLYMRTDYVRTVMEKIRDAQNLPNTNYRYSDLGFILLGKAIENVVRKPMDEWLNNEFYTPMGLYTMTYSPLKKFNINQIAPTEDDRYFRNQIIQGDVHDMAAAMLGGVAGHAGLFSNSVHLATLMQMLLNGGKYGGEQYLKPETIKLFTTRHPSDTRRGIGFDMPQADWSKTQNVTAKASRETFGHLGFTGTAVWADPQEQLVFVFISNRTYPTADNNRLERRNYRMKAHAIAYEAISKYDHSRDLNASL